MRNRQAFTKRFSIIFRPKVQFITSTRSSGLTIGRDGRGLQHQEVKMKLITRFELAAKNEYELHALLREAFNDLARSKPDSHQRRTALASIENIQNELTLRFML